MKKKINNILKVVRKFLSNKKVGIGIKVMLVPILIYLLRSFFIVAWVNGRPIYRTTLTRELERQGGQEILDSLIEKTIIYGEAKKENIKVEQSEIDAEIKKIEDMISAQGMTLDEALSFRNQTRSYLIDQIKIQKLVEKLLASKIEITDDELKTYFTANKTLFGQNPTFDKVKENVRSQVFQQKLSEEYSSWITELKTKAKILYFVKL